MGQGQSREEGEELMSGIRVTQGLLEQLSGKPRHVQQAARSQAILLPKRGGDHEAEAIARQDRTLSKALTRSRRLGNLLLKQEDEELRQISGLADELIQREYSAPSRPPPCEQYAAACLECYRLHPSDPLQCAMAVDAYAACARQAWAEAMREPAGAALGL